MTVHQKPQPQPNAAPLAFGWRVLWLLLGAVVTVALFMALAKALVSGSPEEPMQPHAPSVAFSFNKTGAGLFKELTRKNVRSGDPVKGTTVMRHLAILLDGMVMSAPTINSEISTHGMISGHFTEQELDRLVNVLRAGAVWGPSIHPHPVEEIAIGDTPKPAVPGGGLILVYEIDPRNSGEAQRELTDEEKSLLCDKLRRAIDPNDQFDTTVRPAGKDRIQVVLPSKSKRPGAKDLTAEDIKRIRRTIAKVGSVEFRILANSEDDKMAIEDTIMLINTDSPEGKKTLDEAQLKGLPPPAPRTQGLAGELKVYDLVLADGAKSRVTYGWVELGAPERRQLGLDDAARDDPTRNETWKEAAKLRGKAATLPGPDGSGWMLLQGALFYSRECKDRNLPEDERAAKQIEYFVLARNPEIDPTTGKETPRIDGRYIVTAYKETWTSGTTGPSFREYKEARFVILGVLGVMVILLMVLRRWIGLRWDFLIGQVLALLGCAVVLLVE
jgi:hypothetical protein